MVLLNASVGPDMAAEREQRMSNKGLKCDPAEHRQWWSCTKCHDNALTLLRSNRRFASTPELIGPRERVVNL